MRTLYRSPGLMGAAWMCTSTWGETLSPRFAPPEFALALGELELE